MSINAFHSPPSQGGARGESVRGESEIKWIVIHCSATKLSQDFSIERIRKIHVEEKGMIDVGYHYYIRKNGVLEIGRPEDKIGAHVKGFNDKSIGVCYEGGLAEDGSPQDTRTAEQIMTMHRLLRDLRRKYPTAKIVGHRDLLKYRTKSCPCFDAIPYYQYLDAFEVSK